METLRQEQNERQILKGEQLRKGEPQLIGRAPEARGRSEAEDLRSKFAAREPRENPVEQLARQRLLDAQEQSAQLLEESAADAARMIEDAREQAEALLDAARSQAQAELARQETELRQTLENEYRTKYAAGIATLGNSAKALEDARRELLASIELPAFELMQAVARQLLGAELSQQPARLIGLIRRALSMLSEGSGVSLRLSPAVHGIITGDEQLRAELEACRRRGQQLEIEADVQLADNAFRLLTDGAEVAFDLEECLGRLDAMLAEVLFSEAGNLAISQPGEESANG